LEVRRLETAFAPVGAQVWIEGDRLLVRAVVLSPDGSQRLTAAAATPWADAVYLGHIVAEELLAQGAAGLIDAARSLANHFTH
jgi:hydroxymethylbilane synthase